jgi:hypothetical protein
MYHAWGDPKTLSDIEQFQDWIDTATEAEFEAMKVRYPERWEEVKEEQRKLLQSMGMKNLQVAESEAERLFWIDTDTGLAYKIEIEDNDEWIYVWDPRANIWRRLNE